jgi:predicted ATPase
VLDVALKEGKSAFGEALGMLDQETIDHIIQDLQEQGSCSTHLFMVV